MFQPTRDVRLTSKLLFDGQAGGLKNLLVENVLCSLGRIDPGERSVEGRERYRHVLVRRPLGSAHLLDSLALVFPDGGSERLRFHTGQHFPEESRRLLRGLFLANGTVSFHSDASRLDAHGQGKSHQESASPVARPTPRR